MKKTKKINNIVDLRNDLIDVYDLLRNGEIGTAEVKDAANLAGKIHSSCKIQMEYNRMVQSKERIPFLEPDFRE
jgi:hypothetical protein